MDNEKKIEEKLNNQFKDAEKSIKDGLGMFNNMFEMLSPKSPPKQVIFETVIKKGFFGFGRKVIKIKANAYISMNNILCLDFPDKEEMKKYFESLK